MGTTMRQLVLPHLGSRPAAPSVRGYRSSVQVLLEQNLDFHDQQSGYASHHFHAFPAKFPPQLPHAFITHATQPGDVVLDPMMGSGTTIVEAYLAGRRAYGLDIDPLALRIAQVKVSPLDVAHVVHQSQMIVARARKAVHQDGPGLLTYIEQQFDDKSRAFIDYWFAREIQLELAALSRAIAHVADTQTRSFFEVAFSAVIITKNGGVSLALDLAHTRPHRAKVVFKQDGSKLYDDSDGLSETRAALLTKKLRSPIDEFTKRVQANIRGIPAQDQSCLPATLRAGDAQAVPLPDGMVDLIVTSPPYASNAIDYMRAHKFALVWLGYPIDALGQKRQEYIGGEGGKPEYLENLSGAAANVVADISALDPRKGVALHRYYSEMTRVLREMWRVLKPGRAAVLVVGSSVIRGRDTEVGICLADIGQQQGFEVLGIGVRNLDRNRRMLPASAQRNHDSQIQQRMHQEYVVGLFKLE